MILVTTFSNFLALATKPCHDEDIVDRLNNSFASYVLIALGISIFAGEYAGNPLTCFQKPQWPSSWVQYAEDYCFIEGTYYVPVNESLVSYEKLQKYPKLNFYQWTPFAFVVLGILLTIPRRFWTFINWSSCLHMNSILEEGRKSKATGMPSKEFLKHVVAHMKDALHRKNQAKETGLLMKFWIKAVSSHYLSSFYMVIKFLNIVFVFFTLSIIPLIIAHKHSDFLGFKSIGALLNGLNWRESELFPRVSICAFKTREVYIAEQTIFKPKVVQCVLSANRLIEQAYFFIWFGLSILLFLNILNYIRWLYLLSFFNRRRFLRNIMKASLELVQPTLENDIKYQAKLRHDAHNIDNKFKHLENAKRKGDIHEIEIAQRHYHEAKQKAEHVQQEAQSKRSWKREAYTTHLDEKMCNFIRYMGADGYLTIRLLYANTGSIVAGAVASRLFWKYLEEEKKEVEA